MDRSSLPIEEDITPEDTDDPNKHSNHLDNDDHFSEVSHAQKLLDVDDQQANRKLSVVSNMMDYTESPRTKLSKFIPDSPFKINGNLCDSKIFVRPMALTNSNKSFHVSLSMEDDADSPEVVFSKSYDCSDDIINSLQQHAPITRSVSEDILQTSNAATQRRISVVSSSKGKLMAVPRVHPGEKIVRSPSTVSQVPFGGPSRVSSVEEMLPKKSRFTWEKKKVAFCLCLVDFTAYLSMSIIAPFFPREAAMKGMREAVSGFVFSIYALVIVISSPILGKLNNGRATQQLYCTIKNEPIQTTAVVCPTLPQEVNSQPCHVAAVAEWYRYRIVACLVTSSSPVPLKTRRVGQQCTLNLSRAETSSRWCGVVVRRGGCQLRCRPRHLTMVQNYVVRRQKPLCS
ncbi:MFS-type transporter SLC18B1 [Trichonephila clavipes]|uniref:MFS-type transporter SLC18B1 n=1 Tax=Trichonephila clavipes TaxID=2585209 RepID=A0A8X6UVD6_TRICX|nr:MFS-type transporter SLC18B1 [Trichonephila clavipes]